MLNGTGSPGVGAECEGGDLRTRGWRASQGPADQGLMACRKNLVALRVGAHWKALSRGVM